MPTQTLEEYLETIYKLSERGEVRPTQVAEALGVSAPTVTATLKRLESRGFIERPNGGVALTPQGLTAALDIVRRHRIAERFLVDTLGLPWSEAHEEACRLEHALSPRVMIALEAFLENPESCPHGHPIPAADGTLRRLEGSPLSERQAGSSARIVTVAEDDEALLTYLASLGLVPGTVVEVREVSPFGGPLLVVIGGSQHALARDIAEKILAVDA